MKRGFLTASLLSTALLICDPGATQAQFRLKASTLAGAVGVTSAEGTRVIGTTGVSFTGISFDELNATAGGFWYTTKEMITIVSSEVEQIGEEIPREYELQQNYPNPFNPATKIKYGLPESANVRLTVFNVLGQLVATVVDKQQAAGYYEIDWSPETDSGISLPSGLYFYRVETKNFSATRSMVFQK